jgi:5-formyltetrahydrofolate cyclo-ligase
MSEALSKADLRQAYRGARRRVHGQKREFEAAATAAACLRMIARLSPRSIASYCAAGAELDLAPLHTALWTSGKTVLLPRVSGPGALTWHSVGAHDVLVSGAHGIREPHEGLPGVPLSLGCLLFVPGVAFSSAGRRLGQGAGYYDRLLPRPGVISIGIGFACQHCADLPHEGHDRVVDGVILSGIVRLEPPVRFES